MESLQTDKKSNFFDAFLSAVMCKKINNCLRRAYTRLSLKTVLNDFRLLSLSLKKTKVIEIDESILFFFSPQFLDNGTEERSRSQRERQSTHKVYCNAHTVYIISLL